jgi:hypothetical protein
MYRLWRDLMAGITGYMSPGNYLSPRKEWGPFVPEYEDVCKARAALAALNLPMELVLHILEYAEYWPSLTWSTSQINNGNSVAGIAGNHEASVCIDVPVTKNFMTTNIGSTEKKMEIKSIEFLVKSQDQGWTSEMSRGTFNTSSWLEVSILRKTNDQADDLIGLRDQLEFNNPTTRLFQDPRCLQRKLIMRGYTLVKRPEHFSQGPQEGEGDLAWYLQGNRVAAPLDTYNIVWTRVGYQGNAGAGKGEGFLGALQSGDQLLVWARSKVSYLLSVWWELLIFF